MKVVKSTHTFMMEQAESLHPPQHGDVIISDFQSGGKGLAENSWESEAGKNLLVSFFIAPDSFEAEKQFYLNIAVSLSVYHTLRHFIEGKLLSIKWPNDLYVDKKKIAGILISHAVQGSQIEYSVVSIGLNVNQKVFVSDAPNPVSLIHFLNTETKVKDVLNILLKEMNRFYSYFVGDNFDELHRQYLAALFGMGQWRNFSYNKKTIRGKIIRVSDFGQLELETDEGRLLRCNFKEIEYIL